MELVELEFTWVQKILDCYQVIGTEGNFGDMWNGKTVHIDLLGGTHYSPVWESVWSEQNHLSTVFKIDNEAIALLVAVLDCFTEEGIPDHFWDQESNVVVCWVDGHKKVRSLQKHMEYMLPYRVHVDENNKEKNNGN